MSAPRALPAAELAVGGGLVSLSPLPGQGGDLRGDIAALSAWGADLLISLVEPHELPEGFFAALEAARIEWLRLPIADFGLPEGAEVGEALPRLLDRLGAGQRLAFHCMGGCGRSGMIVLRLMVLVGEPPETALARLRALRPCAVETPEQLAWAQSGRG